MGILTRFERRLIGTGQSLITHLLNNAVRTFSDYKQRHIGTAAASISFYAIFSVFPLLAFLVYVVGKLIGDEGTGRAAPLVLKILRDFVPAMQGWIEKGLFDVIKGHAVTNWVNAILLGWSGLGLFSAMLSSMEHLPDTGRHAERAHLTEVALAFSTLGLLAVLTMTLVFCELTGHSAKIPFFMQGLPFALQDALFFATHSGLLLPFVSIGCVAVLFKLLLPCPLRIRSALVGGALFSGLLMLSRAGYWIYLHYNKGMIQSSYGIFSTLILIMIWVHFIVSCLMFSCLFALHLDKAAGADARHGGGEQHGGEARDLRVRAA